MKVPFFITAIGLLGIFVYSTHSSQKIRNNYNQPCSKIVRCKSEAWLACDTETEKCLCAKPDEMIYDPVREKCVALIGERCKFGFDDDDGPDAWYQRADCVQDSICGPSGMCYCPKGFFEDRPNNQCTLVKDNGQFCQNKAECNEDKFLSCIQGTCQCDPENALYNYEKFEYIHQNYHRINVPEGTCISRVGSNCSLNYTPLKYCVRNSQCDSETCRCSSDYIETTDKLCGRGYDQPCSKLEFCSDRLRCSGFIEDKRQRLRCLCPHKTYQEYDKTESKCRSLVGGPCDPNDSFSCINNTVCIERDNLFQCQCDVDFTDTAEGICTKGFGSPCNYIDGQVGNTVNVCDPSIQLECKEGKCSCENDADIYEPEQRKCLAPVGMRCQEEGECVSNCQCLKSDSSFWGRCTCNDGFEVTPNHTCAVPTVSVDSTQDSNFRNDSDKIISSDPISEEYSIGTFLFNIIGVFIVCLLFLYGIKGSWSRKFLRKIKM